MLTSPISRSRAGIVLAGLLASMAVVPIARAQHNDMPSPAPGDPNLPMPLYSKVLGRFERPISSTRADVQAYFNQGFQLEYAFDKMDAVRSFREAEKRDPDCAICFWGEAWAWGSYLNGPMDARESPYAWAAAQRAVALAPDHATPVERAFIQALSVRYVKPFDPRTRKNQDAAYAEAMRNVHEQFPNDLDAGTLYADALFLMEPPGGSRDISAPSVQRILGVLEGVLAKDIRHVGACHLYIHLTEATVDPGKAEACAEYIGNAVPGASHLNHMPSHTWNGLGRWGDSVRANLQAWHSDQKAAVGEGFAIYPTHNLYMLGFAASMDGQGAIAMQAGKDFAKLARINMLQVLTLVRFGRFDEIPAVTRRADDPIDAGVWDFGQGYALLRSGDKDFARAYLNRVLAAAEHSRATFRSNSAHDLLGTLGGILEGEMFRADGDLEKATLAFERAVARQDAMIYDEPEPLPFAARHWLGAALLETKHYADAERVYREELKKHPNNGWSLFGLKAALDGQAKPSADVEKQFEASWVRSDTWIHASRF
jgi:tetratricopeptide (TPR) repeat protein